MKELKLETISISEEDIITTSGKCTASGESYILTIDRGSGSFCGWDLYTQAQPKIEGSSSTFAYFDENGAQKQTDLATNEWPDGDEGIAMWFHYNSGNFYLCDKSEHHHTYVPE